MSIRVMSWLWDHSTARGTELLVLLALADFADDSGGNAWPSMETLSKKCRQDRRTVQRTLVKLEDEGLVKVARNAGPGGVNRYVVVMPRPVSVPSEGGGDLPGAADCRGGVQTMGGAAPTPPEPSFNRPVPPPPPASGGRVCTRHSRPRSGCADCATFKPVRPPWCGQCDETTRLVEVSDSSMARCPDCHPKATKRRKAS